MTDFGFRVLGALGYPSLAHSCGGDSVHFWGCVTTVVYAGPPAPRPARTVTDCPHRYWGARLAEETATRPCPWGCADLYEHRHLADGRTQWAHRPARPADADGGQPLKRMLRLVAPDPPVCPCCGTAAWVSVSLDGGWTRRAQCVHCGHIHPAVLGDGWRAR